MIRFVRNVLKFLLLFVIFMAGIVFTAWLLLVLASMI